MDKFLLIKINEMKETIQNLRIYFKVSVLYNNKQSLHQLKDYMTTIKLENDLLLEKIEKRLIFV